MTAHLHFNVLYRGPLVSIRDVRCRPTETGCGAEEESSGNDIVFPRSGAFVKHVGRHSLLADCNHVLFFNGNEPYRVSHPVAGGDDCTTFSFDPQVLLDALTAYEPGVRDRAGQPFPITHDLLAPRSQYLQQGLRQRLREGNTESLALDEMAIDLLHTVLKAAYRARGQRPVQSSTATARVHRDQAEATKTFLARQFQTPLALPDVARAVHASPYHLARLFRRETGIPIHQYLNRLRLGVALERLADGVADLTGLALDLGYSSHSHFSEAFRRAFGASPSAFRKQTSKNLKA